MVRFLVLSVLIHGVVFVVCGVIRRHDSSETLQWMSSSLGTVAEVGQSLRTRTGGRIKSTVSRSAPASANDPPSGAPSTAGGIATSLGDIVAWGNRAPSYPKEALRYGWEGEVRLRLVFGADRTDVELLSSSGFEVLDEAAVHAAEQWKLPESLPGDEARMARIVPVQFRLREQKTF